MLHARITYANVISSIALFVALGGGAAYAALELPDQSVGARHLKDKAVTNRTIASRAVSRAKLKRNAVNTNKVQDLSLMAGDFKRGQLPIGETGGRGEKGAAGASAVNPVPSGETIRGAIGGDFHAFDATASDFGVDMTLPIPAANNLSDGDVFVDVASWQDGGGHTTPTTTDTNPGCSGTPGAPVAPAGKVCIYVSGADHAFDLKGYSVLFGTEASPYGFKLKWIATQVGDTFVDATWAYKAP